MSGKGGRFLPYLKRHGLAAVSLLLAAIIVGIFIGLCFRSIQMHLPYPRNVDEPDITVRARRVLATGNLNTAYFQKPPFPTYLAAAGLAVGYIDAVKHKIKIVPQDMGSIDYPYYTYSRVLWPARALFALMGALALLLIGVAAWRAFDAPPLVFLVPFIGMMSPFYFYMTSAYINVDIAALFFSALLLAWVVHFRERQSFFYQAIAPGALAGLAAACKYNYALALLPVLLMIALYGRRRRCEKAAVAVAVMPLAFLAVSPYALLDLPTFLRDVALEVAHYANGHPGHEAEPGWAQVQFYFGNLGREFGGALLLLALAGLVYGLFRNWRTSLLLYAFPILFFLYMCSQRVNFLRGILLLYAVIPVAAAVGLLALWQLTYLVLARVRPARQRPALRYGIAIIAAAAAALLLLPHANLAVYWHEQPDSRRMAVDFVLREADRRVPLLVPEELGMDVRPLINAGFSIAVRPFAELAWADLEALHAAQLPLMILPRWGYDARKPGQELSAQLNQWTDRFEPIADFGSKPVLTNANYYVGAGDPKIYIAQTLVQPEQVGASPP